MPTPQATNAIRRAFQELGEGPHALRDVIAQARQHRPQLGAPQADRALERLANDGEILRPAPGFYQLSPRPPTAGDRVWHRHAAPRGGADA